MSLKPPVKFTVECEMNECWVPHFLGMLKWMQKLGGLGSSRKVTFFSDGDGDFRPNFIWDSSLPEPKEPKEVKCNGDVIFDAG